MLWTTVAQARGDARHGTVARAVCGAAPAGHVRCAVVVLRLRDGGALARPVLVDHPVRAALTTTALGAGAPSASRARLEAVDGVSAADASTSPGQSPPQSSTAAWLQQAYDLTSLSAARGAGDTVAVIDAYDDPGAASDLAIFRAQMGLPACAGCFTKVNEFGQASPLPTANESWGVEESTDVDAVAALCPNCHILLVETNSTSWSDMLAGMRTADTMGAKQISDSWTSTNVTPPSGQLSFSGVAVIAAAGDNGYVASGANYPAAAAGVTAAGGTELAAGSGLRGFTETAWSDGGSGCATAVAKPAWQGATGCSGRAYADVSADADPNTGLAVYDSAAGGWILTGGTSLASPLIAAFEAVAGVAGQTPQWAYADSAQLNDLTSGSNGSCPPRQLDLCTAGIGYDGPTGVGSISGQLTAGGPGIGAAGTTAGYELTVGATTASLSAGVYPNGLATTVWWQYGTGTSYGESTAPTTVPAATSVQAVPGTLAGLSPSTTYHYRLVAENADGEIAGYDESLTTAPVAASLGPTGTGTIGSTGGGDTGLAQPPSNTAGPRLSGTAATGRRLLAQSGSWSVRGTLTVSWEILRGGRWQSIPGAAGDDYVVRTGDVGHRIRVLVTDTSSAGRASAASAPSAPVVRSISGRLSRRVARAGRAGARARRGRRRRSRRGR